MDDLIEMLRTPLTSIRAPAELLEEAADALEAAREDAERLAEALRYAVDNPEFNSETFDKMARAALHDHDQEGKDG